MSWLDIYILVQEEEEEEEQQQQQYLSVDIMSLDVYGYGTNFLHLFAFLVSRPPQSALLHRQALTLLLNR